VRGLSPTVELGAVWRRDDRGAILCSFLRAMREARQDLRDENATGSGGEQPEPQDTGETA